MRLNKRRTPREVAAILAGLKMYKNMITYNKNDLNVISDLADGNGEFKPLSDKEIDQLCYKLNQIGEIQMETSPSGDAWIYGKSEPFWREDLRKQLAEGNKINAIKLWRHLTKCGLKEAEDYIETIIEGKEELPAFNDKRIIDEHGYGYVYREAPFVAKLPI